MNDEKEGKSIIDKLIDTLLRSGKVGNPISVDDYRNDDNAHNKNQTEEDYQKEQMEWLKQIRRKKDNPDK